MKVWLVTVGAFTWQLADPIASRRKVQAGLMREHTSQANGRADAARQRDRAEVTVASLLSRRSW